MNCVGVGELQMLYKLRETIEVLLGGQKYTKIAMLFQRGDCNELSGIQVIVSANLSALRAEH